MTRAELIAALEKAEGPSRELDYSIRQLVGAIMPLDVAAGKNDGCWVRRIGDELIDIGSHIESGSTSRDMYLPRYTGSLDAARMLLPEGATWTVFELDPPEPSKPYGALVGRRPSYGPLAVRRFRGDGATPALALCIPALKARE